MEIETAGIETDEMEADKAQRQQYFNEIEDEEEDSENSSDEDIGCAVLDDSDFEDMLWTELISSLLFCELSHISQHLLQS